MTTVVEVPDNDDPGALDLSAGRQASEASTSEVAEAADGDGRASHAQEAERDARAMGWRPESEWDGPPGKWIDAKTFIERGEQIMPILRANNKKMREELLTRDKDLATLRDNLATANKAIAALRKGYTESTKREVELAIADLKEQYKDARAANDVDLELKVKDNLDKLTEKARKIGEEEGDETPIKETGKEKPEPLSPEYIKWQSENKWFGNEVNKDDKARSDALIKIAKRLRSEGDVTAGLPFMEKCMEILEEQERGYSRPKSKVESGGGKGGGSGRAFDKLPADAKKVCHEDNDNFVGPGKMFKTVKEWEDHYANLYGE